VIPDNHAKLGNEISFASCWFGNRYRECKHQSHGDIIFYGSPDFRIKSKQTPEILGRFNSPESHALVDQIIASRLLKNLVLDRVLFVGCSVFILFG